MTKEQFYKEFKNLADKLQNTKDILKFISFLDLADKFSVTRETMIKWYKGLSAPLTGTRNDIIKHLHAEVEKEEMRELIRQTIKDELKVKVSIRGEDVEVSLLLGDNVFDSGLGWR